MTEPPETRYTRLGDVNIAYQVTGSGPPDLVLIDHWANPLELVWDEPVVAEPLRRLASFSRLIRFDRRGFGLSDRVPLSESSSVDEWMQDVSAVMDAVGSEAATIVGMQDGAMAAILFAATHPERVAALVIVNSHGATALEWLTEEERQERRRTFRERDSQGLSQRTKFFHPSLGLRLARWHERNVRHQVSVGTGREFLAVLARANLRSVAPSVQAPTLVLRRRDGKWFPTELAQQLADRIPGARYVEIPGEDEIWWGGNADVVVDEIEEFVTGAKPPQRVDRAFATIVFTDIVRSTERVAAVGDQAWRQMLEEHDGVLARAVERFGGRRINTTGDGILATFESPGRAIRFATTALAEAAKIDVQVRAGIHAGEIELRDADVSGLGVHIASRVKDQAGAGEVVVSRTVADLVVGSEIEFDDHGEHDLKGVPGKWQLYAVRP